MEREQSMAILVFQHEANEDAAMLGHALAQVGHRLRVIEIHRGQSIPVDLDDVEGIVSMGGNMNVDDADQLPWINREMELIAQAHQRGLPICGVCLGAQLIAAALGGEVGPMDQPEIGWHPVKLAFPGTIDPIFAGVKWQFMQFHMHGQQVTELPPGATGLASSNQCQHQAFKVGLRTYGFQFHFEWTLSDIAKAVDVPWIKEQGHDSQELVQQGQTHQAAYRQFGDRLAQNLASLMFPVGVA